MLFIEGGRKQKGPKIKGGRKLKGVRYSRLLCCILQVNAKSTPTVPPEMRTKSALLVVVCARPVIILILPGYVYKVGKGRGCS